jgi:hypothetical protein
MNTLFIGTRPTRPLVSSLADRLAWAVAAWCRAAARGAGYFLRHDTVDDLGRILSLHGNQISDMAERDMFRRISSECRKPFV